MIYGIEEELERLFVLSDCNWRNSSTELSVDLIIAWSINETGQNASDIVVFAEDPGASCKSKEQLENRLAKMLSKRNYNKAKLILDELILRNPYSSEYSEKAKIIRANLNESE